MRGLAFFYDVHSHVHGFIDAFTVHLKSIRSSKNAHRVLSLLTSIVVVITLLSGTTCLYFHCIDRFSPKQVNRGLRYLYRGLFQSYTTATLESSLHPKMVAPGLGKSGL